MVCIESGVGVAIDALSAAAPDAWVADEVEVG